MSADATSRRARKEAPHILQAFTDRAAWIRTADILAVLIAAALPISTSAVEIIGGFFVATLLPTIEWKPFTALLKRPAAALPLALVTLALLGLLWSDATWLARAGALKSLSKLLMLPLLLYHFSRSSRGTNVFIAFLASCTFVMLWSFVVAVEPQLAFKRANTSYGVPVKDYIDQSQEFALCLFVVTGVAIRRYRDGERRRAVMLLVLASGFIASMAFLTLARTAFVYMPVMLLVLVLFYFSRRIALALLVIGVVAAGGLYAISPNLQEKVASISSQYEDYRGGDPITSVGLRLEYWRKSLKFVMEAPLVGHGTGSTRGLFERETVNPVLPQAQIVSNPHNQTLNVAVQWGLVGIVLLYALWTAHGLLFWEGTDIAAWVGLLVVVQNVVSSLFNSHLFDFHEGWMYVLGVGVAGGMILQAKIKSGSPDRTIQ